MSVQRVSMYYAKCDAMLQVDCQSVGPETMEGPRKALRQARDEGWAIAREGKAAICPECQGHGATLATNVRGVVVASWPSESKVPFTPLVG